MPTFIETNADLGLVGFTAGLGILVAAIVGLLPSFGIVSDDLSIVLKRASTRSAAVSGRAFRSGLVIAEIALSMMLLIGSGLLIRSFHHVVQIHPGFNADKLLTLMATLPRLQPVANDRGTVTGREILTRLRALPGVTAAAISTDLPLGGGNAAFYTAEGQPIVDAQIRPRTYVHRISTEFFSTLQTRFVVGRAFNNDDIERKAGVVIVTVNLTDRFWPGQDPIGKRIKFGAPGSSSPWFNIVGVVEEMKYRAIPANPTADPDVFLPISDGQRNVAVVVRASTDPAMLASAVRASIRAIDSSILIYEVAPMAERVARVVAPFEFAQWLMSVFAGLALILSVTGLYAVIADTVRQRTREFGVRIAMAQHLKMWLVS